MNWSWHLENSLIYWVLNLIFVPSNIVNLRYIFDIRLDLWPWSLFWLMIITLGASIHLHFIFNFLRQILSVFTISALSAKFRSLRSDLLNISERGPPAAHFGSNPISLRQILKIQWPVKYRHFTLRIWPLTLTFDLDWICHDEKSIWDPSRINLWVLVILPPKMWN